MPTITIKDKQFAYTIKRKSIRSINLRFLSSKSFYVSCNLFTPTLIINRFIRAHQDWIYQNSAKFTSYPVLKNLKKLIILDQVYQVKFNSLAKNSLIFHHKSKIINIYTKNLSQTNLKKIFETSGRKLAKILIQKQIESISFSPKSQIKHISVRNQKSRFGSCSGHQRLSFNWQIIFFPPNLFRHIICHELVHLKIKNHKKDFYQALSLLDSDWKKNNSWLKTQAKKYFLIKP